MSTNQQATAYPGSLDSSFGDNGISRPGWEGQVRATAIDSKDRHYVVGTSIPGGVNKDFFIARLTPDGQSDQSFGVNGLVARKFPGQPSSHGRSLLFLGGNMILLIAATGLAEAQISFTRLFEDGTTDSSFGTNGYIVHNTRPAGAPPEQPQQSHDEASVSSSLGSSAILQADGKIVVHQMHVMRDLDDTLAQVNRFNSDGTLDPTFNGTGSVTVIHPDYSADRVKIHGSMEIQNGKIMVCGALRFKSSSVPLLARYNPDGSLDTTFGTQGFVLTPMPEVRGAIFKRMAQQHNNRILAIGYSDSLDYGVLMSTEPDGSQNIQFNKGQPLFSQLGGADITAWLDGSMQPDGKNVVIGAAKWPSGPGQEIAVTRISGDGSVDGSFNPPDGWVSTQVEAKNTIPRCMVLHKGKITVAGHTYENSTFELCILRYNA